jgi:hypothetical protein
MQCDDVIGPTDGLTPQDRVGEGAAPREAREHGFDKVTVICKGNKSSLYSCFGEGRTTQVDLDDPGGRHEIIPS